MYIQADQFQKLEENLNIDHCNHATIINKILITSICWILTACSRLKNGLKALKETLTGSFFTQARQHFLNCCLDKYFSRFVFRHFRSGVQMIRALQCSVCSRTLRGFRQGRERLSLQNAAVVSLCIKNTSSNVAVAQQSTAKSADVPINPVLPNMYNYGSNYV